jgi:NADP-dependent 3-hydroxy acid dehydrogenase YdfG
MINMKFEGKTILISGATGGMAEEMVKKLSKQNCKLALFARRENKLKELSELVKNNGSECIYKKCDVKNPKDVSEAVNYTMDTYKNIDLAILTAGVLVPSPIQNFDAKIIKDSIDINFMGMVYFIEKLLPVMKKQKKGVIAATSTLPDRRGISGWGAYGASKAALSWLMEGLRAEAKQRYNIDFITIKPGSVETPMIEDYTRHGSISAKLAAEIMLKGISKGKKVIQFPLGQVLTTRIMDPFPATLYDLVPYEIARGPGYPEVKEGK